MAAGIGLAGTSAVPALLYGLPADEETDGLLHLPMQAGFGVALVAAALWFGVVCVACPHHLGSAGTLGGLAVIGWGAGLVAVAASEVTRQRREGDERDAPGQRA